MLALDATDRTATDEAESDDCSGERTSGSLDSILQGGIVDDAAVRPTSTAGLFVLPRGGDPSLARKLNDELVNRATAALRSNYDFVLVDGGDWGNALVPRLANHMDAVYLCVQSQWTTETGAQRAVSQLRRSGVRLAGCVLSGAAEVAEKSS